MSQLTSGLMVDIVSVSEKFRKQLNNIRMATEGDTGDARLQERIVKGSAWFDSQLEQLQLSLAPLLEVNIGNKVVASDFDEHSDELRNAVELKRLCFKRVGEKGFSTETFNKAKVDFFLDKESGKPSASKKSYLNRRNQPKPKKQPTWVESLQLFLEGKNFKEIASARNLTVHTIENHIVKAIEEGKLNIDKIMSNEEVTEINSYVSSENPLSLTQIFEHFENKYPYYKIRAALVFQQS